MTGKAKVDAATTNRGGGKAGLLDRSGVEKGGHAKLECPLCKEDFERIFNLEMLIDSYTKFCRRLQQLEPDHGALGAIAEGTINVREDPILREHDVEEILTVHTILSRYPDFERWQVQGLRWEYDIHPCTQVDDDIELALEEMRKYLPLKGHRKMQLMLEFVHETKSHVLDTLCLEAWKDVKFVELFG